MLGSNRTPHAWKRRCTLAAFAVGLSACIDPNGKYEAFLDRAYVPAVVEMPDAGDSGCPPLGDMPLPDPSQLSGTYFYAVSLPPYADQPTIYLLEAEASRDSSNNYTIRMRNRPLEFSDRKTPTGEWSDWQTTTVSPQGCYELADQVNDTPGDANALGFDVTSVLTFAGNVGTAMYTDGPTSPVKFWCGTAIGKITAPIAQDVTGTFTATRIPDVNDPSTYPPAVINCAMDPAQEL